MKIPTRCETPSNLPVTQGMEKPTMNFCKSLNTGIAIITVTELLWHYGSMVKQLRYRLSRRGYQFKSGWSHQVLHRIVQRRTEILTSSDGVRANPQTKAGSEVTIGAARTISNVLKGTEVLSSHNLIYRVVSPTG